MNGVVRVSPSEIFLGEVLPKSYLILELTPFTPRRKRKKKKIKASLRNMRFVNIWMKFIISR